MTDVRNDSAYLRTAIRNAAANEVAHDQTKQRKFERMFESRDLKGSRAAIANYSDGGKASRRICTAVDEKVLRERHVILMRRAVARLPRGKPTLKKILWGIFRNGKNRSMTIRELGISKKTYKRGLNFFLNFYLGQ